VNTGFIIHVKELPQPIRLLESSEGGGGSGGSGGLAGVPAGGFGSGLVEKPCSEQAKLRIVASAKLRNTSVLPRRSICRPAPPRIQ
jgi:hypothetical protein